MKTVHTIGNGQTIFYNQGINIIQAFSPYNSPSVFSLLLEGEEKLNYTVKWTERTNRFDYISDGKIFATDDICDNKNIITRKVNCDDTLNFVLIINKDAICKLNDNVFSFIIPENTCVYSTVYTSIDQNTSLTVENGKIVKLDDFTYRISMKKGNFYYCGFGEDVVNYCEDEDLTTTDNEKINKMIVYINHVIKSQTSLIGGVLAGYPFHLGYVRDTSCGVVRGLTAMNNKKGAFGIINYFRNIFNENGFIKNAHPLSQGKGYHEHENDDVEVPGYILLMIYECYMRTGDASVLKNNIDIIDWAIKVQSRNLYKGMLPYNGDETYIAGRILPRTVMDHGSCEATMLYIYYTEKISDVLYKNNIIDEKQRDNYLKDTISAREQFESNFIDGDTIYVNNPERENGLIKPLKRKGVCQYCGQYFTELTLKGNNYCCHNCESTATDLTDKRRYIIPSVALMTVYLNMDLISQDKLKKIITKQIDIFTENKKDSKIVGYEGGLMLYAAVKYNYKAKEVADILLSMADEFGAYSEFYVDGVQDATKCRPWESAINIEALINYCKN